MTNVSRFWSLQKVSDSDSHRKSASIADDQNEITNQHLHPGHAGKSPRRTITTSEDRQQSHPHVSTRMPRLRTSNQTKSRLIDFEEFNKKTALSKSRKIDLFLIRFPRKPV
jgi:hypothetical protein